MVISLSACETTENYKTILLKTTGSVEIEPDEASIRIQLNCVDKDISTAKNQLIKKADMLYASLKKHGINDKDILTTRVDMNKDYTWKNNTYVFKGYKASTTTNVKVRDLKILEDLYPELLSNEQLTVGGLSYQHSKMDSLNEVAYLNALEKAKTLADKIISTLPEQNKVITQISNIEITKSGNTNERKLKGLQESEINRSAMTINVGNMIAQKQLYVEFKIY